MGARLFYLQKNSVFWWAEVVVGGIRCKMGGVYDMGKNVQNCMQYGGECSNLHVIWSKMEGFVADLEKWG